MTANKSLNMHLNIRCSSAESQFLQADVILTKHRMRMRRGAGDKASSSHTGSVRRRAEWTVYGAIHRLYPRSCAVGKPREKFPGLFL